MKLGRKPRGHDTRIPKYADLIKDKALPTIPTELDYDAGMPANLGMMLNDTLGDCCEAGAGHAQQVWTFCAANNMVTPSDADVELLYEKTAGYVPGNPSTDNGTDEQTLLNYWLNNPFANNQLSAYVELNPSDFENVKRAIWEAGVVYIGMNVPQYIMDSYTAAGSVWDVHPELNNNSAGGHCVIMVEYKVDNTLGFISWGGMYTMTKAFWDANVDECYALVNKEWIELMGISPAGLSLVELEALMAQLKFTPSSGKRRQHRRKKRQRAIGV